MDAHLSDDVVDELQVDRHRKGVYLGVEVLSERFHLVGGTGLVTEQFNVTTIRVLVVLDVPLDLYHVIGKEEPLHS